MIKIAFILGTRPEAIKLVMLINKMKSNSGFVPVVIHTGQHLEMINPVFELFGVKPDIALDLINNNKNLNYGLGYLLPLLETHLTETNPDLVIVQGDTLSCYAGALAAFNKKIQIAHVEAGLRTYDLSSPYPEEAYRQLVDKLSDYFFAPTESSKENLMREGKNGNQIFVTGNTGIDSLLFIKDLIIDESVKLNQIIKRIITKARNNDRKIITVTLHRRETSPANFKSIISALNLLSTSEKYTIVFPAHLSPRIRSVIDDVPLNQEHFKIIDPLDYGQFVALMMESDLIVTDSGGIQEEAPYLNKKVLVVREKTERVELDNSQTKICGYNTELIIDNIKEMIEADNITFLTPYGSGDASKEIIEILHQNFSTKP